MRITSLRVRSHNLTCSNQQVISFYVLVIGYLQWYWQKAIVYVLRVFVFMHDIVWNEVHCLKHNIMQHTNTHQTTLGIPLHADSEFREL